MSTKAKAFPSKDEHIIGVVSKITKHGVYIKLIEYGDLEGYCHISEVAAAWIRNIRNFVRLEQQVVAKVLRADKRKGQVDISIKRVSAQKKKEKIQEYKQHMSALAIVRLIAEKVGRKEKEVLKELESILVEEFGSLYHGFEYIATEDDAEIREFFSEEMAEVIEEMAKASIKINTFEKEIKIGLRSYSPDGVDEIREVLMKIQTSIQKRESIEFELFTVGAPTYRLWLSGRYYEDLDEIAVDVSKILEEYKSEHPKLDYTTKEEKR